MSTVVYRKPLEKPEWEKWVNLFSDETSDKNIDEHSEYDWLSLTVGWAIAKGFSPTEASEFSYFIRYSTNLG